MEVDTSSINTTITTQTNMYSESEETMVVTSNSLQNLDHEMISLHDQSQSGRDRCNEYMSTVVNGVQDSAEIMQMDVYHLNATVLVRRHFRYA